MRQFDTVCLLPEVVGQPSQEAREPSASIWTVDLPDTIARVYDVVNVFML